MAGGAPPRAARPYRDFLTPALHRRFTGAALLSLAVCYVEGLFMASFDRFWTWFPVGPAGLRTLILFMATLLVFILRVAQLHVGSRNTPSPFSTAWSYLLHANTFRTFSFYTTSALLYSEIYIWSQTSEASLAVVDHGRLADRPRLNERPIYIRAMFLILAGFQAAWHMYHDYDRVQLPAIKVRPSGSSATALFKGDETLIIATPIARLRLVLPSIVTSSAQRAGLVTVAGPVIYGLFLRRVMWYATLQVASILFTLPKNSKPGSHLPFVFDLLRRFAFQSFLLVFLWEFTNAAFSIYLTKEPLKKGVPLTNDSKDPNGSLIAGLKAKKDAPRSMAFWELGLIASKYDGRRVSIYKDLDRAGGSAWVQILTVCLAELHAIVKRIQDFQSPPKSSTAVADPYVAGPLLPKLSKPLQAGDIFAPAQVRKGALGAVERGISDALQQNCPNATISPKRMLTYGKERLLTKEQQEQLSPAHVQEQAQSFGKDFVKSVAGRPFRQTFARKSICIVLGTPYGNSSPTLDAIASLATLAVHSLKEDPYGKVHGDVATIIRTFTSTIEAIEGLMSSLKPSWTDVDFKNTSQERKVAQIDVITVALRSNLSDLVNEFGEYQDSIGLTMAEMRKAKEAVHRGTLNDAAVRYV